MMQFDRGSAGMVVARVFNPWFESQTRVKNPCRVGICSWMCTGIICAYLMGAVEFAQAQRADAPAANANALETLGNDRLMSELSTRGLDDLLNRYFEVNHVPAAQQKSIRALGGLRELLDPNSTLTPIQRLQRVREAAQNVDVIIAGSTDPQKLVELSSVMIENAVNREVNALEYWGMNPVTEQRLRPVAQAVYKLLGAASKLADDQANAIASQIKRNDDPRAEQWEKLDNLSRNAKYQQSMTAYFVALSLDPSS